MNNTLEKTKNKYSFLTIKRDFNTGTRFLKGYMVGLGGDFTEEEINNSETMNIPLEPTPYIKAHAFDINLIESYLSTCLSTAMKEKMVEEGMYVPEEIVSVHLSTGYNVSLYTTLDAFETILFG